MSEIKRDFQSMLEDGRITSLRIQEYFKRQGYKIINRFDDEVAQSIGVDFEIYDPKRWLFRVEVKADSRIHKTGNLFIEHKMERSTKTSKGWMHYCLADTICYHDSVNDIGYLIDWRKMRDEVSGFPLVHFKNPYDAGCVGYGYLVPVEVAKERGFITLTYSLAGIGEPKE